MAYNYNIPYKSDNNMNIGKTLYILGTATNGPVNEPIRITDAITASSIFGPGSLSESAEIFFTSGGTFVYLVRITGTYATMNINGLGYELLTNPVTIVNNKLVREKLDLRDIIHIGDKILIKDNSNQEQVTVTDVQFKIDKSVRPFRLYSEVSIQETLTNTYITAEVYKVIETSMVLTAMDAGEAGNDIRVIFTSEELIITRPNLITWQDGIFRFIDYPTVSELASAINKSIPYLVTASSILDDLMTEDIVLYNTNSNLTGGTNGLTAPSTYTGKFKNYLHDSLIQTLDILHGKYIDIICLADMYFDDIAPIAYDSSYQYGDGNYVDLDRDYLDVTELDGTQTGFHKIMINFCKLQVGLGIFTHCIMGFNTLEDNLNNLDITLAADFDTIYKYNDYIQEPAAGSFIDNGNYLSLCFGDLKYSETLTRNWFITYAALWLNAGLNDSMTSIKLPDTIGKIQEFDLDTLDKLTNFGLVTYKYSAYYGWCVTCGITKALDTNPLKYTINNKIVQRVISQLNIDLLSHTSGTDSINITNKSIGTVIETSLKARKDIDKIIYDYEYSISYDRLNGNTEINIDIYSVWSIEKISVSTNIQGSR